MLDWAFATDTSQTDVSVKRFAISFMKEPIKKVLNNSQKYRAREKKNTFGTLTIVSLSAARMIMLKEKVLDKYYDKNKLKIRSKTSMSLIYTGMCALALILLLVLFAYFSGHFNLCILIGLAGSFLLM